ncbi:hypothetical protein [Nocardia wallacei]|uniref:hypothetical protein n=1 Tax=Nocardia wallacei TaxID=480035 RepID=UPI002457D6F1|nr:hypothetical protein [Nocardia wallacei]
MSNAESGDGSAVEFVADKEGSIMRYQPTALGWVVPEVSDAMLWDRAQVQRLARHLGYLVVWPEPSLIPLADQVRAADVDVVITPSPRHLSPLALNAVLYVAEIETLVDTRRTDRTAETGRRPRDHADALGVPG